MSRYNEIDLKTALELMLFGKDCYFKEDEDEDIKLLCVWEGDAGYYIDGHGDIHELHEILDYNFYEKNSNNKI